MGLLGFEPRSQRPERCILAKLDNNPGFGTRKLSFLGLRVGPKPPHKMKYTLYLRISLIDFTQEIIVVIQSWFNRQLLQDLENPEFSDPKLFRYVVDENTINICVRDMIVSEHQWV